MTPIWKRVLVRLGLSALLPCPHAWRPGSTKSGPVKWCPLCDVIVHLTEAEFYAHFGRAYSALIHMAGLSE